MNKREKTRRERILEIIDVLATKSVEKEKLIKIVMTRFLVSEKTAKEYVKTAEAYYEMLWEKETTSKEEEKNTN